MRTQSKSFQELYEIAENYDGYFTAKHARQAGYSDRMQTHHVQNGDWVRESRGIYRLSYFPPIANPDLPIYFLWSCDRNGVPQGVISHDTAMELHNLSTWRDSRVHITVPSGFRRAVIPQVVALHHRTLEKREVMQINGVNVTAPLRTIIDVLMEGRVTHDYLEDALQEAFSRDLILPVDIKKAKLSYRESRQFNKLLREVGYAGS